MITGLMQIRSGRAAFCAALAITAAVVAMALALTATATYGAPVEERLHAVRIAAWVSGVIGAIVSSWFVASLRAILQRKDAVDRLARTDDLTGLDNRRAFLAGAEREIARAARQDERAALLILDLDHFKRVNDTHGHRVGDLVLMAVAEALSQRVPECVGALGRLGGEEFAILLPGCDEEGARQAAERIRGAVESVRVPTPYGEIATTVSIGCAAIAAGDTVSAALQKADEALYEAKRGGRNRVAVCRAAGGGGRFRERPERSRREAGAFGPLERSA